MTWAAHGWIRAVALLHCQWTERETEAKGFSYLWIIIHGFGAGDSETFLAGDSPPALPLLSDFLCDLRLSQRLRTSPALWS